MSDQSMVVLYFLVIMDTEIGFHWTRFLNERYQFLKQFCVKITIFKLERRRYIEMKKINLKELTNCDSIAVCSNL